MEIPALAAVYASLGWLSLAIAPVHDLATAVWAPTGIALAALLRGGLRLWPGVALGAFLLFLWRGAPPPAAFGISVGNTLEAILGAYLFRRLAGPGWSLHRLRDVLAFIVFGAVLSSTVSASMGVSSLVAAGFLRTADGPGTWLVWWLGDLAGALVIAPALLVWSEPLRRETDDRHRAEAAALGAATLVATLLVFFNAPVAAPLGFLQACLLIPLLSGTAVRFGVRGATAAVLLVSFIAIGGTTSGLGPFALQSLQESLLYQQAFMSIVAGAVLVVGAMTAERAVALSALREALETERRLSALLRTLADSIPDPVFVKDEQSRVLFANPATLSAIGKPAESVLGRSDREYFDDEETGAAIVENDRRVMATGHAMTVEERVDAPDGRRWYLSTKAPVLDAAGKVTGVVGVTRDITARKRAEDALREREELLRLCVEHAPAAVAMFDRSMRYLVASRRYLDDFKLSEQDVLGRSHYEVFPEVPERWRQIHRACLAGAVETCEDEPFQRADGTIEWVRWEIHPWHTAAGEIGGVIQFTEVTTERKRSTEALRASEERFRLLVQGVSDCAIYMLSQDGRVTSWSAAAERMFGYREDEIVGQHRRILFTEEQRAAGAPLRQLEEALAVGRCEEEALRVRKDGSRFWANVLVTPLRDDRGGLRGFANVSRDFTERKRVESALKASEARLRASEAALREIDEQKNRFLATLSHELRNPLAPIRNSLYILERVAPGGEQARRAQAVIQRQIGQMAWLVDDLLDVTRIAHGKIRLQRERLDLNELAHRVIEDHRADFIRAGVRMEVQPARSEVWVEGDRVRLVQVIGNLLQNAVKFTSRGGKTTIGIDSNPAGQAILTVQDTGSGIEPDLLPRLFRAFEQADTARDHGRGGLGLGLALVKGLVELHGGTVSAASAGPGKGARFTVTLPLSQRAGLGGPARFGSRSSPAPRRVLVIEDNEDAANSLREVLELDEHVVEVAYTGREGIGKAREFHPDVVLCDIGLPEIDGYEVARMMRADPEIRGVGLIALSGFAQAEDVELAREAGFDAHLAKPPSIETLERALVEVGGSRQDPRTLN